MKNIMNKAMRWLPMLAAVSAALSGITMAGWFKEDGAPNWGIIIPGIFIVIWGAVTKFRLSTGGTLGITTEGQARTGEPITITPTASAPAPILPAINAETNVLGAQLVDLAARVSAGAHLTKGEAGTLRTISDRLFAIGADPMAPLPPRP